MAQKSTSDGGGGGGTTQGKEKDHKEMGISKIFKHSALGLRSLVWAREKEEGEK